MPATDKRDYRGSLWRRWDLHFHTPSSFDYRGANVTDEMIIETLRKNGVSVVAITDHHLIDPDRIDRLRQLAGNDLTILPGIELRSELGGSDAIHYIGIFPETADVHELWSRLQGKLDLAPSQVATAGDDKIWVAYDKGATAFRELGGLVSIHAGKKTNTFEGIKNTPKFKQKVKTDILREHVDLLEVKSESDCHDYKTIVFPKVGFMRPIVVGSDNHDIAEYSTACPCWIRGDATFDALKHVCCEPDDRVFLGDTPPLLDRVAKNRTKYIRSVEIRKIPDAALTETWFDNSVPLNHGLVAVIGNKGSGKSALADVLGLLGDSHAGESFSFLTEKKFCKPNNNKARFFTGTLTWESDGTSSRSLSARVSAEVESVKYLPQEYIEGVCNELQEHGTGRFSRELASVIFSHVDSSKRLDFTTFDELLAYKTTEKQKAIDVRRAELKTVIAQLVEQERLCSPAHVQQLKERIAGKQRELEAHDTAKPVAVQKPEEDEAARVATEAAEKRLAELASLCETLKKQVESARTALATANKKVAAGDRLKTRLGSFLAEVEMLREQSVQDCATLAVSFDALVKVVVDTSTVDAALIVAAQTVTVQTALLDPENKNGPLAKIADAERQMAEIRGALAGPSKRYQQYLVDLKLWQNKRTLIEGAADVEDTLVYFQNALSVSEHAAAKVTELVTKAIDTSRKVYQDIRAVADVFSELYAPVQDFIEKHPLARAQFQMSFETKIVETRFAEDFLAKIAQNRRGSFAGSIEGRERINRILGETDFNSEDSTAAFLQRLWDALHTDLRNEKKEPAHVSEQLAKGVTPESLYQDIFRLNYLSPFYTLRWGGKDVQQLSPGERGTLLLVFYLLIDRSDIPLIIDQPEENLDNQTVFNVLVPSIKEARGRRQLIIVTHNPNLAVVCDADQVICASIDKQHASRVTYEAGAIENPAINKRLLDILEGTRPAFDNRDSKYQPPKPA